MTLVRRFPLFHFSLWFLSSLIFFSEISDSLSFFVFYELAFLSLTPCISGADRAIWVGIGAREEELHSFIFILSFTKNLIFSVLPLFLFVYLSIQFSYQGKQLNTNLTSNEQITFAFCMFSCLTFSFLSVWYMLRSNFFYLVKMFSYQHTNRKSFFCSLSVRHIMVCPCSLSLSLNRERQKKKVEAKRRES